jgi:penicillin-binding protein 1A
MLMVSLLVYLHFESEAEKFDLEKLTEMPQRNLIFDSSGKEWCRIQGQNRTLVPLKAVSNLFIQALLAREDSRFYSHDGVDLHGICRALVQNIRHHGIKQGGSTITQQLARSVFNLTDRSVKRKLLEIMLARRIEDQYSKEEILNFYVNQVYFGGNVYGIESASQTYFGKHCASGTDS